MDMGKQGTPRTDASKRLGTYANAHRQKRRWLSVLSVLAAAVVFVTVYALMMPAVTMTAEDTTSGAVETVEDQAALPEGAQVPEGYTQSYTAKAAEGVLVTVHAEEGAIPEGATLKADVITEGSEKYLEAERAVAADAGEGSSYGFAALDIRFEYQDGTEAEPNGSVYVAIDAAGILPEDADPESVTIQHLAEDENGTVTSVDVVADTADATAGVVATDESSSLQAAFTVDGFSTFAVTWDTVPADDSETVNGETDSGISLLADTQQSNTDLLTEDFTGSTLNDPSAWTFVGSAGLTAADSGSAYYCSNNTGLNGGRRENYDYIGSDHGDGFLLLTDIAGSRSGTVLYNEPIQSSLGLDITFWQYQFGGTGADGIGFYLVDGSAQLTTDTMGPVGSDVGGAFGYTAYQTDNGTVKGIENGVLAVGLDAYGTFSATNEAGGTDSHSCLQHGDGESSEYHKNSVTIRGAGEQENGSWTKGYKRLFTTQINSSYIRTEAPTQNNNRINESGIAGGTEVHIVISPADKDGNQTITVTLTKEDGSTITPINNEQLEEKLPDLVKFGFTASTGGSNDAHFIRGLRASTVIPAEPGILLTKTVNHDTGNGGVPTSKTSFSAGETVPYMFVVRNTGGETLTNVTINDPLIQNVHLAGSTETTTTTLEPGDQAIFYGSLVLTRDQAKQGSLPNTATATGTDPSGSIVTAEDTETIETVVPLEPLGEPQHSKKIGDNGDGTYTLALDVVGNSQSSGSTSITPVDIVLIIDRSSSMNNAITTTETTYTAVNAEDVVISTGHLESGDIGSQKAEQDTYGGEYFIKDGDQYVPVVEETQTIYGSWYLSSYKQHLSWTVNGTVVDPSTTQFYTREATSTTMSRMEAVKTAASNFVDSAAADAGASHIRIGVVSFAGSSDSDNNASRIDCALTNVAQDQGAIKNAINNITAPSSGAGTYPAQAFSNANSMLASSESGTRKVVVFFTDGGPGGNTFNPFDNNVASGVVSAAKPLKTNGVTVYSVGVLEGADPSASISNVTDYSSSTDKINAFMHAVSSNYPDANGFVSTQIGDRAPNSDYYKVANDADQLNDIFQGIIEDTLQTSTYTNVSIVDELSQYAQVAESVVWNETATPVDGFYPVISGVTLEVLDVSGNPVSEDSENYPSGVSFYYKPTDATTTGSTGTVKAEFAPGYSLEKGWTYTLKFDVSPTDAAYQEFTVNGYGGVTGDQGTDLYNDSTGDHVPNTSAGKGGFHSNKSAYVEYKTVDGSQSKADYDHPVIQVKIDPVAIPGITVLKKVTGADASPDTFEFTATSVGETADKASEFAGWTTSESYSADTHTLTFSNSDAISDGREAPVRQANGMTFDANGIGTYTYVYRENATEGWAQVSTDPDRAVGAWKVEIDVSLSSDSKSLQAIVTLFSGSGSDEDWQQVSSHTYTGTDRSADDPITVRFENQLASTAQLPETGGSGTTLATVGGIALIAAAGCGYGLRRSRERRGDRS